MARLRRGKVSPQQPTVLSTYSLICFNLYLQATLTTTPSCDTNSLLTRSLEGQSSSPTRHVGGAVIQHSVIAAASTPQHSHHHRVGIIVGACLGAAGAMLLIGLVLFWLLLRHRHPTATAEIQDVIPRNCQWVPRDFLGGHGVVVVANHPSRSIDLAGADTDTASVAPTSDETSETKQWNKSTEVLDISMENAPRSPLPPLPLPEPIDPPIPSLCIHTNVQAELSPPSSQTCTPAGSSRSPIRPLPMPPTRPQVRRHRSAKVEEAHLESCRRPLPHRKISADDVRAYVHGNQRSTAHSVNTMSNCDIVQHHNGGINAWTDFPPPYSESLPVQEAVPSTSQAMV